MAKIRGKTTYVAFASGPPEGFNVSDFVYSVPVDDVAPAPPIPGLAETSFTIRGRWTLPATALHVEARLLGTYGTPLTDWLPFTPIPAVPYAWESAPLVWTSPEPAALVQLRGTRPGHTYAATLPVPADFPSGQRVSITLDLE